MPVSPSSRRSSPALLLLAALPAVVLVVLVVRYWVNLPVSDEWGSLGGVTLAKLREGSLSPLYLFSQHTESRPFFPRLAALALDLGNGRGGEWDVRRGMVFNLLLMAGISALLWRVLDRARPAGSRLLVLAAMNVLLFSPVGWEIWLLGQGYLVLLTLICLAGTLAVNASGLTLRTKAGLNAALAFVGTFSFANGLLLWPLGWPVQGTAATGEEKSVGRLPRGLYAGAAVASFGLFFAGFRAADRAALPFAATHPGETWRYFLTWCAVPFRPGGPPDAGHFLVGALVVGTFAAGAFRAWRTAGRHAAWPWLTLGAFALLSGGLAAAGRARTGLEFALSSRYAVTAGLLPVAALGAWWTGWRGTFPRGGRIALGVLAAAGLVLHVRAFPASVEAMRGAREAREKARDALTFIDLMPDNPQFRPIVPDAPGQAEALRAAFHRFSAVGLLRVFPASPGLETVLRQPPPAAGDAAGGLGAFDTCTPRGAEQIVVTGWARDLATGERPAPFVVFQWTPLDGVGGQPVGPPRPWTVLRADRERPDVARALGRPALARCGFAEAIYRPRSADGAGAGRVAAWVVDPVTGKARSLGPPFDVPPVAAPKP